MMQCKRTRCRALNPVFLREMRRAVRNHFLLGVLGVYLLILLYRLGYFLLVFPGVPTDFGTTGSRYGGLGTALFSELLTVLGLASGIVAVVNAALRCITDGLYDEMLRTTTLTPGQRVRGHLFAGLALSGCMFSMTLPFMTLAYLLRGIDILRMLFGIALVFLLVQFAVALAVRQFIATKSILGAIGDAMLYFPFLLVLFPCLFSTGFGCLGGITGIFGIWIPPVILYLSVYWSAIQRATPMQRLPGTFLPSADLKQCPPSSWPENRDYWESIQEKFGNLKKDD